MPHLGPFPPPPNPHSQSGPPPHWPWPPSAPPAQWPSAPPVPTPSKTKGRALLVVVGSAFLLLLLVGVLVSGRGSAVSSTVVTPAAQPPPVPVQAVQEPVAAEPATDHEQLYLGILDQYGIPLSTDERLTIGPRICSAFDQGNRYGVVERGVLLGEPQLTQAQAGYLIGAAVGAYCMEHAGKISSN